MMKHQERLTTLRDQLGSNLSPATSVVPLAGADDTTRESNICREEGGFPSWSMLSYALAFDPNQRTGAMISERDDSLAAAETEAAQAASTVSTSIARICQRHCSARR